MPNPISTEIIQSLIIEIRGERVLLDSDVARIYGVDTKRINEAVKNNPEKFPNGYIVRLSVKELEDLRSKFSTSNRGGKVKLPTAFPERGLYMLATILKSSQATKATFAIIDHRRMGMRGVACRRRPEGRDERGRTRQTFTKIRELSSTIKALSIVKDDASQKSLMQRSGEIVSEIFDEALQTSDTDHWRGGIARGSLQYAA
ncbi:MAG: ORF6N domain-containing protein [bacterium]